MLHIENSSLEYSYNICGTTLEIRKDLNGYYLYNNNKKITFDNFSVLRDSSDNEKAFLFVSNKNNITLFQVYDDSLTQIFSIENTQNFFVHNNKPLFQYITIDISGIVYVMDEQLIPSLKITETLAKPESEISMVVSKTENTFIPSFDLAIRADCSILKSIAVQATRPYESDIVTILINLSN